MINKSFNHLLCVIISVSMAISLVSVRPVTANADDNSPSNDVIYDNNADSLPDGEESVLDSGDNEDTKENTFSDGDDADTSYNPTVALENEAGKSQYGKDFLLSDGTRLAAVYPFAVHFEDDGKWTEIDNTLVLNEDGNLKNKANNVKITLPEKVSSAETSSIAFDGSRLSFSFLGVSTETSEEILSAYSTEAKVLSGCDCLPDISKTDEKLDSIYPFNCYSKVTYEEVLPETDLSYSLVSTELKENIILKSIPEKDYTYHFTLESETLSLELLSDKSIEASDETGEVIFSIPAPYAYDSTGEKTGDIEVTLINDEDGIYHLTYKVNYDWLKSEDRVYPVTIDPTILTRQIRTNIQDMTVASGGGTDFNDDFIEAGYDRNRGIERTYIKFTELPALSAGDVIVNADICLYREATGNNIQINAHEVNSNWSSRTITWSNKPSYNDTITDYAMVGAAGWYDFSITELVRDWYKIENRGVLIKANASVENAGTHNNRTFKSSDYGNESYRPIIILQYINNTGLESYWDYDSYDAGRAGTASVNLFTGNLVVSRTDMGFSGNKAPVSITFYYNTNNKSTYGSGLPNNPDFGLGKGWKTNYNQLVRWFTAPDGSSLPAGTSYYQWEDGDGTIHYFKNTETSGTYKDESGQELTLTNTGSGNSKYIITDKEGNQSQFDTDGRLTKIVNNQETKSEINIAYTSIGSKKIDTITDGAGRVYKFNYSGGYISSIQFNGTEDSALQTVDYTVNSDRNLTAVTYADGQTVNYTYTNDLMITASDSCGNKVGMTYDTIAASDPNRLKTQKGYLESATTEGQSSTNYTYDLLGRTASVTSSGSSVSYTYSNDRLSAITHGGAGSQTTYSFYYGDFGVLESVLAGSHILVTNTYSTNNYHKNLLSKTYGNGQSVNYTYDSADRLTSTTYGNSSTDKINYVYDNESKLAGVEDVRNNLKTRYLYDLSGRTVSITDSPISESGRNQTITYSYDNENNVSGIINKVEGISTTNTYSFNQDNQLTSSSEGNVTQNVSYDDYGRVGSIEVKINGNTYYTDSYTYYALDLAHTSLIPSSITRSYTGGSSTTYSYTYTDNCNIETVSINGVLKESYSYDGKNQLIKTITYNENNITIDTYTYDLAGNITSKTRYNLSSSANINDETTWGNGTTITYGYTDPTWKDLLTSYNGITNTNDAIGNRTSDGTWTYTWEHGRQLSSMSKTGQTVSFAYGVDGLRLSKTVTENGTSSTVKYYYNGSSLTDVIYADGNRLHIIYDGNGSPLGFTYQNQTYFYEKNLQGDILGIRNSSGNVTVSYTYDSWGKITSQTNSNLAEINPLRYRGYVYDEETGLYYLQSRYYDPEDGRFINADECVNNEQGIKGSNAYMYCLNNPIMFVDFNGKTAQFVFTFLINLLKDCICSPIYFCFKYSIKSVISLAATGYLYSTQCSNAGELFNSFIWGFPLSDEELTALALQLKESKELKTSIINFLKDTHESIVNGIRGIVEFKTEKNLLYAIGKASYFLFGIKQFNGKWRLRVDIYDTYNFDEYRSFTNEISMSNLANNLGRTMQLTGMGYVYSWKVSLYGEY